MSRPCIVMRNFGGLGNRMIRYMFAHRLARELGGWPVVGYDMPEWGLVSPAANPFAGTGFSTGWGHVYNVAALATRALAEQVDYIEVEAFAQRCEFFADQRAHFAAVFAGPAGAPIADHELAISVRTGDIIDGYHKDYTPLPLAFYHRLLAQTGLAPVFVGQLEDNWYTRALRDQFPHARYLSADPISDFQTLRGARHVMLAVSSFSWLAAWLSDRAQVIHMPVAGLFNPQQRGDIDLLPVNDPRWHFHQFAPGEFTASDEQKAVLTASVVQEGPEVGGYLGYRTIPA